jgi:hypothetical protein
MNASKQNLATPKLPVSVSSARTLALGTCIMGAVSIMALGCQGGPDASAAPDDEVGGAALASPGLAAIYDDALAAGWSDQSWAAHNLANNAPVAQGVHSISVTFTPWSGVQLLKLNVAISGLTSLDFQVNAGTNANPVLNAYLVKGNTTGPAVAVAPYCEGGALASNAWTSCHVPLAALGFTSGTVDGIEIQEGAGRTLAPLFLDALALGSTPAPSSSSSGGAGNTTWLFRDALQAPWIDASWVTHKLDNTSPVQAGSRSISVTMTPWTGLSFAHVGFSTVGHTTFSMQVNGGTRAGNALLLRALVNGAWTAGTLLGPNCVGGTIPANAWTRCDVPITAIAPLGSTVTNVVLQEARGLTLPTFYVDEVGFDVAGASAVAVSVAVTPSNASLVAGQVQGFSAVVTGSANTAVTWTVAEGAAGGTINAAGRYTAPSGTGTFHVVATSQADSSRFANATVTVGSSQAIAVQVTPTTAAMGTNTTQQFAAVVTGSVNTTVTWAVQEGAAGGNVSSTGLYTAPSSAGTFHVVASSVADGSKQAVATVTVTGTVVSGTGTSVNAGTVSTQTWTAANSPYRVLGDITVPAGSTLTVQPGVTVLFMGHYRMTVTGAVDARGTAGQPIVFTAQDHTAGWYGMRLWNPTGPAGSAPGHQYLENCVFEYAVKLGNNDAWYNDSRGALFVDSNVGTSLHINNNVFRFNTSIGKGAALMLGGITGNWTLTGNTFQSNRATDQGGALDLKHCTAMTTLVGGAFTGNSTAFTTTQPNSVNGAGGAIVVFDDSNLTLAGVSFSGNSPDDWAGVVPTITGGNVQVVSVSVSPASAAVTAGGNKAFSATVSGSSNTAVTWSVQEGNAGGSITAAGVYTAPSSAGTYHVVATSQADVSKTASAAISVSTVAATSSKWVTGYYAGYQAAMYPAAAVDFTAMTHLVVGAALPRVDGSLDTSFYIDAVNGPALARDLTARAHAAGRKAILMVGGAGVQSLWQAASTPAVRPTLVQNILATMTSLGFDGVDLDWEPVAVADQPALLALAQALRTASPGIIITVPVTWVSASAGADAWFAQLAPFVDQINLMSYQMADAWPGWQSWHSGALGGESATTPSSVSSSANAYAAAGVPKGKLGIGIGFYGSCWRGVTGPRQAATSASIAANDNVMTYAHIMSAYFSTAAYQWDAAASVGSLSFAAPQGPEGCTWVSYEDDASIAAKGQWVKANGFGGTIIWTINQGYIAASGTNPPLDAIKRAFLQ